MMIMSVSPQELRTRRQASGTPGTPRTLGQVELGELYRYGVIHYSGDQSLVRAGNLHHLISSSPSIGTDLPLLPVQGQICPLRRSIYMKVNPS